MQLEVDSATVAGDGRKGAGRITLFARAYRPLWALVAGWVAFLAGCAAAYLNPAPAPPHPMTRPARTSPATAHPAGFGAQRATGLAESHHALTQAERALAGGDLSAAGSWLERAGVTPDAAGFLAFRASWLAARLALAQDRRQEALVAARTAAALAADEAVLEAALVLGDALHRSGRSLEALDAWLRAAGSPFLPYRGDLWDELAGRLYEAAMSLPLDSPDARASLLRAGRALYRMGRYAEGVAVFSRAGWQEQRPEVVVELARGLAATGERLRRLELLRGALAEGKTPEWPAATVSALRLQLAEEWMNRGETGKARDEYLAVLRQAPRTPAAGEALYALVRMELEGTSPALARQRVEVLGPAAAGTRGWRDALLAILAAAYPGTHPTQAPSAVSPRDLETARWALATLASEAGSDPAYLYWQARLLDDFRLAGSGGVPGPDMAPGAGVEALVAHLHGLHPLSYYSVLARRRWPELAPPLAEGGTPGQPPAAALTPALAELAHAGFTYEVAMELRWRVPGEPSRDQAAALALWELQAGRHAAALGRLTRLAFAKGYGPYDPLPRWLMEALFPRPFREVVESEARRHGVDPLLLFAVMREESAFEPRARSAAGAFGLMQLLVSTAGWMAGRQSQPAPTVEMLYDPAVSVRLGAAYLRFLLDRFPEPALAVAAYHAGQGRVSRWLAAAKIDDAERFVEWIPVAATRDYVQKVLRSYEVYRLLYGSGAGERRSVP